MPRIAQNYVFATLFTSFFVALLSTPVVVYLSSRLGVLDEPNARKIHSRPVACLGGLSVALGLIASCGMFLITTGVGLSAEMLFIMIGSFLVLSVGFVDDLKGLTAGPKLTWEIVAALIPLLVGFEALFPFPWFDSLAGFGMNAAVFLVALTWIVGVTNAVNISDGMDGLAPGLIAISAGTICLFAYHQGLIQTAVISGGLAVATIGFLPFNIHRAQVFLGDTGSLFMGYLLGTLSVTILQHYPPILALCILPWLVGIPVIDTLFAVMRRAVAGKPLMDSDQAHIHHRLKIYRGFSYEKTVFFLWSMEALMGAVGLALARLPLVYSLSALSICSLLIPIPIFLRETIRGALVHNLSESGQETPKPIQPVPTTGPSNPSTGSVGNNELSPLPLSQVLDQQTEGSTEVGEEREPIGEGRPSKVDSPGTEDTPEDETQDQPDVSAVQ